MSKSFGFIFGVVLVVAFSGCAKLSVTRNSVKYTGEAASVNVENVETGNPAVKHVRTQVVATDPAMVPNISGSMTDIPNGKQFDVIFDKRPVLLEEKPVIYPLPPAPDLIVAMPPAVSY